MSKDQPTTVAVESALQPVAAGTSVGFPMRGAAAVDLMMRTVFGEDAPRAWVARVESQADDADPITRNAGFRGRRYGDCRPEDWDGSGDCYFSVALLRDEPNVRRKDEYWSAAPVIVLDDALQKVPVAEIEAVLGPPTFVVQTSKESLQLGYVFETPLTDPDTFLRLVNAIIARFYGSVDPGMAGLVRYVRLGAGWNSKQSRINENNGRPQDVVLLTLDRHRRVKVEDMITALGRYFEDAKGGGRRQGAPELTFAEVNDAIEADPILWGLSKLGHVPGRLQGAGYLEIECPWRAGHSVDDDRTGWAPRMPAGRRLKCHHGKCANRRDAEVEEFVRSQLASEDRREFEKRRMAALAAAFGPLPDGATLDRIVRAHGGDPAASDSLLKVSGAHPLAKFVRLGGQRTAPIYTVHKFIGDGVVAIAGAHGAGKTTAMGTLALIVAGLLPKHVLAPKHWRHVVYISEDTEQFRALVAAHVLYGGVSEVDAEQRVHLVEAYRLAVEEFAAVGKTYAATFTRTVRGTSGDVPLPPLVIVDTRSASFNITDENDNSEASKVMNTLKQDFAGLPVWIIGHVSKADMGREGARSSRGATAFDADARQQLALTVEGGRRYLTRGKSRIHGEWSRLALTLQSAKETVPDQFGDPVENTLYWAEVEPVGGAAEDVVITDAIRQQFRRYAREACLDGGPLTRRTLEALLDGNRDRRRRTINAVLSDGALTEVRAPAGSWRDKRRPRILVDLNAFERERLAGADELPEDMMEDLMSRRMPAQSAANQDVATAGIDDLIGPLPA